MLRTLKLAFLKTAGMFGAHAVIFRAPWRRRRLLILCYHGISIDDEHIWNPQLYMAPATFRTRMEEIRRNGCNVIALGEALEQLYNGDLSPRSVAITFDDGNYDFYRQAFPVLKEFGFPATVYLTTYYTGFNRPVFDVMLSYLLFKGLNRTLNWPEVIGRPVLLNTHSMTVMRRFIRAYSRINALTGEAKDSLLRTLAGHLEIDYDDLCRRRLLHLMNPSEVREVSCGGVGIQLHTHRHCISNRREVFEQELSDNGSRIREIVGIAPSHFCYPSGLYLHEFPAWLRDMGIRSATTCTLGLASRSDDPYLLPRFLDAGHVTNDEFRAWLSGLSGLLPQRRGTNVTTARLLEEPGESPDELLLELSTFAD